MNQSLPNSKRLKLARCLTECWRAFAEEIPLPSYKISTIDNEEPQLEEKAHRVLLSWYQSNPDSFNEQNIIEKLKSIKRFDIIRNVFGEVHDPSTKPKENGAPKVEDLSFRQIGLLSDLLDPGFGYEEFAHRLLEDDNDMINDISKLRHDYAGGGNPAYKFIKLLLQRRPKILLKDFLNACKVVERNDIILYAEENLREANYINEISERQLKEFADKVRGNLVPSNWHHIASEFSEFSNDDIKRIELERMAPNSYSPTKKLFEKLQQVYPTMELQKLISVCTEIKRIDVALKLREFAK